LTSDYSVLQMVEGLEIEFIDDSPPKQTNLIGHVFNAKETKIIDENIEDLLSKMVIEKAEFDEDQFISPIFLREKRNGEYRLILNLKNLNAHIPYRHFKMDTFEIALTMITKDMFMCSIDLRHAYYSVPVAKEHRKYLRFVWKGQIFEFTCAPNGLSCLPNRFTKLLKPVYAKLRTETEICTGFIDDSLIGANSEVECSKSFDKACNLLQSLGFMINTEKSVVIPTQKLCYLGNIIDSKNMIVFLPDDKKDKIQNECKGLSNKQVATIRQVAHVIGLIVASFSAVEFGKLHYRVLERAKARALRKNCGNYDAQMCISQEMKSQLQWWYENVHNQFRKIDKGNPEICIQTDASLSGWGAVCENEKTGGRWTKQEKQKHINELELLAILFSLKSFISALQNKHVKVLTDSTTAVCYVSNMGGTQSIACDQVSQDIWAFCIKYDIWISCTHIAGKDNKADMPSREFNDRTEWSLCDNMFKTVCARFETPNIDLFASRLNAKLEMYCAWKPDPEAKFIDAFMLDWASFDYCYVFPPFSLLPRCVRKIKQDKAKALVIAPLWPTQTWFPLLMKLLVQKPVILPKGRKLYLPHQEVVHPLEKKLVLMACKVSGNATENKDFLELLPELSCPLGENQQNANISAIFRDGFNIVINNKFLKFQFL